MNICESCGTFKWVNADPWKRPLPLLSPTQAEVVAYHQSGECVTMDPPGTDYHNPANWGR